MGMKENIPTRKGSLCSPDPHQQLLTAFLDRDLPTFQNILHRGIRDSSIDPNHWFEDPHHGTLLDLACREANNSNYVRTLLQAEADPNRINPAHNKAPLHFTIEVKDFPSFELVLEDSRTDPNILDNNGYSPLHYAVVTGEMNFQKRLLQHSEVDVSFKGKDCDTALQMATKLSLWASVEGRDCSETLELLLTHVPRTKLDINGCDLYGNTPLHWAAQYGDPKITLLLLQHGAYMGQRNYYGIPPLAYIKPTILEMYLDQCLSERNRIFKEDEIIFNYNFLAPPREPIRTPTSNNLHIEANKSNKSDQPETELFYYMSRASDLRPLLKHPIMSSFIHFKWMRVRWFFYINLIFFVIFCTLLTVYILCFYAHRETGGIEITGNGSGPTRDLFVDGQPQNGLSEPLFFTITVFLSILITREICQLAISPFNYICDHENWLEIALIAVTISILSGNRSAQQPISAIGILLSWAELMLLIGRHPSVSMNIEMLKVVLWNFAKFFALYSILILAFSLSFYSLFLDISHPKNGTQVEDNFFQNPGMSVFKTIIMLTGEFDTGSIPFSAHPGVSHMIFVLFVFLIPIVLSNLLNGLAVGDTQAIRADAELVSYVSQVKLVYYIETMNLNYFTPFRDLLERLKTLYLSDINCCLTLFRRLRVFFNGINILSEIEPDYAVCVTRRNRVLIHRRDESSQCSFRQWFSTGTIDPSIVKAAREIVISRRIDNDRDKHLVERLDCYKDQLEAMKVSMEETQKMVQQLRDIVANKNH